MLLMAYRCDLNVFFPCCLLQKLVIWKVNLIRFWYTNVLTSHFSVNGESSASAPEAGNSSVSEAPIGSVEAPMSSDCTNTTAEPQSTTEATSCSESHTSALPAVSAGLEPTAATDCAQPNARNSMAADAAKPRESSSTSSAAAEPVRQQPGNASTEPLPPGYVGLILIL